MKRITFMRIDRGLSMSALARKADMHVSSISQIESQHLKPYPGQLTKLVDALGWKGDPMELFEELEDPKRNLYRNEEE